MGHDLFGWIIRLIRKDSHFQTGGHKLVQELRNSVIRSGFIGMAFIILLSEEV